MYKRKKELLWIYIFIGIVIVIILPLMIDYLIFGNNIKSNLSNGEWAGFLGSYTGGVLGGIATLVAVLISLNKGKKIQEESEIRENVLIVYYDLVLGLTDLKKIYINQQEPSFRDIPSRMFFSSNWIKNVALIAGMIHDVDYVYKLYGDLEMLRDEVKTYNELESLGEAEMFIVSRYKRFIDKLSKKVFSENLIQQDMSMFANYQNEVKLDIDRDLSKECYEVINSIRNIKKLYVHEDS